MTPAARVPDAAPLALLERLARLRERARARAGEAAGATSGAAPYGRRDPEADAGPKRPERTGTPLSSRPLPAHWRLTLAERRVLLSVIAQIDRRAPGAPTTAETPFEVTAAGLAELCAIPEPQAYALLAAAADRLARRWVAIEAPDPQDPLLARTKTPLVHAIDGYPAAGRLRLYLAPRILPYLSGLAGAFARGRYGSAVRLPGGGARRPRARPPRPVAREECIVQALPSA